MLPKTDAYFKERYIWRAKQHIGSSEFNFFYDDLPFIQQQQLSSHIDESLTGIPVLFFTTPGVEWTLLCTRQIVGFDGQAASIADIKAFRPAVMHGLDGAASLLKVKEVGKTELDQLAVTMKNGEHVFFHANKGADFYVLTSILLMAVRLNGYV